MKRILKYPLKPTDVQFISIPSDTVLSVQEQRNEVVIYAITDSEHPLINHEIRVIGTGHTIDFNVAKYGFLGTVKLYNGELMFHVFWRIYDCE